MLPTMPRWAFAALVAGGLWVALWRGPVRRWAVVPLMIGAAGAATAPVPALLVTGDGEHLAIVRPDGVPVLLRPKSGDFVRGVMREAAAFDGDPLALDEQPFARCSRDACLADIVRDGRAWRVLAIRSRDRIDWRSLTAACREADIVVASRRLPRGCTPRWLKLDRAALAHSGGLAIHLGTPGFGPRGLFAAQPRVESVAGRLGDHPWRPPPAALPIARPAPAMSPTGPSPPVPARSP